MAQSMQASADPDCALRTMIIDMARPGRRRTKDAVRERVRAMAAWRMLAVSALAYVGAAVVRVRPAVGVANLLQPLPAVATERHSRNLRPAVGRCHPLPRYALSICRWG